MMVQKRKLVTTMNAVDSIHVIPETVALTQPCLFCAVIPPEFDYFFKLYFYYFIILYFYFILIFTHKAASIYVDGHGLSGGLY